MRTQTPTELPVVIKKAAFKLQVLKTQAFVGCVFFCRKQSDIQKEKLRLMLFHIFGISSMSFSKTKTSSECHSPHKRATRLHWLTFLLSNVSRNTCLQQRQETVSSFYQVPKMWMMIMCQSAVLQQTPHFHVFVVLSTVFAALLAFYLFYTEFNFCLVAISDLLTETPAR